MSQWVQEFLNVLGSPWAVVGLIGQVLFFSRWIVQWIVSERRKESHVPLAFWFISLAGGIILEIYAIQRHDPVFMLGQGVGVANYTRNIMLIYGKKKAAEGA